VLDGELYNYELRQKLNELSGLARKQKAKELTPELFAKTEDMVRFYVYDGYDFEGMDQSVPYRQRKAWIDENLPKYTKYCRKVPTHTVKSVTELETIYQSYLADGEEGAIIRLPESAYENKRSKNLLKYKPEYDDECEILKILPGDKGKAQYLASKATIRWKDKIFEATFMGTEEVRTQILKEKHKWEGKKNVTFKHIGLSGKGVPNSARIDPDNCFKGDR
jgi:ATP-dependent DNA ligase